MIYTLRLCLYRIKLDMEPTFRSLFHSLPLDIKCFEIKKNLDVISLLLLRHTLLKIPHPQELTNKQQNLIFNHDLKVVQYFWDLGLLDGPWMSERAVSSGNREALLWCQQIDQFVPTSTHLKNAIKYKRLDIIEHLFGHDFPYDPNHILVDAAKAGERVFDLVYSQINGDVKINEEIILASAYSNQLDFTKNLISALGRTVNPRCCDLLTIFARIGNLEAVQWSHENGYRNVSTAFGFASIYCHLDILKWFHNAGCEPDWSIFKHVARLTYWQIYRDKRTSISVYQTRLEPIVEWLISICPDTEIINLCPLIMILERIDLLETIASTITGNDDEKIKEMISCAVRSGSVKMLEYILTNLRSDNLPLHAPKYDWDHMGSQEIEICCEYGHLEMARWLLRRRISSSNSMKIAIRHGRLDLCKELLGRGFPIPPEGLRESILGKNLEMFQWVWSHSDKKRHKNIMLYVITNNGNLTMIKWLINEGEIEMSEQLANRASIGGQLKLLQWLVQRGCPWDPTKCLETVKHKYRTVYLKRAGGANKIYGHKLKYMIEWIKKMIVW